jgi:beta-phosphoglucomutase-like phosphatase (HAD superfamily)
MTPAPTDPEQPVTLLDHVAHVWTTALWRWLARHGIGDPLNMLVEVRPYSPHRQEAQRKTFKHDESTREYWRKAQRRSRRRNHE